MASVPPKYTAYQGFDALFHSAEGYISKGVNPMSDMFAITAIENIANNLAKAVADGSDMTQYAKDARITMPALFDCDPVPLSDEDSTVILEYLRAAN